MKKKKIIITMFLIAILNMIISNFTFAASDLVYTVLYQKNESRYISYNGVSQRFFDYYYYDENHVKLDTYCINLDEDGAEKTESGYKVKANNYITDQKLLNILNNGYPHNKNLKLSRDEAKFATQFAIWMYTNNLDYSKIATLDGKSDAVRNAIKSIYDAKNTKVTLDTKFELKEDNKQIIEIENKDYYKVKYNIIKGKDIETVTKKINDKNIRIVDEKLQDIENFNNVNEFNILYPVELVKEDMSLNVEFTAKYRNLKVRRGEAIDSKMQDVALLLPEYEERQISSNIKIEYDKLQLRIDKKDTLGNALAGVKFLLYNDETNEILGQYLTDEEGKIEIDFRKDLNIHDDIKVRIEEIKTLKGYKLLESPVIVKLEYGNTVTTEIVNEKEPEKVIEKIVEKRIELPKTGM